MTVSRKQVSYTGTRIEVRTDKSFDDVCLLSAKEVAKTAHLLDEKLASLTTQAATLP